MKFVTYLQQASAAHEFIESRKAIGKVVLFPDEDIEWQVVGCFFVVITDIYGAIRLISFDV